MAGRDDRLVALILKGKEVFFRDGKYNQAQEVLAVVVGFAQVDKAFFRGKKVRVGNACEIRLTEPLLHMAAA